MLPKYLGLLNGHLRKSSFSILLSLVGLVGEFLKPCSNFAQLSAYLIYSRFRNGFPSAFLESSLDVG